MKLLNVTSLVIPSIKVIEFARFCDHRGYFSEHFRQSDFNTNEQLRFLKEVHFTQTNESFSKPNTIRGLHFQWNPFMGKLVRTVHGHMIDLILDIRKNAPTYGHIIAYDMPVAHEDTGSAWIWVPPGFAHGNLFLKETTIEYFCTGEYSPTCEAGISPLAHDIDWSLCDPQLKTHFDTAVNHNPLLSDKDRDGLTLDQWTHDPRSHEFIYTTPTHA